MSGKHVIRVPAEYAALFLHNQAVEAEIRLHNGEVYRLRGVIKKYGKGLFVRLSPEARAPLRERGFKDEDSWLRDWLGGDWG